MEKRRKEKMAQDFPDILNGFMVFEETVKKKSNPQKMVKVKEKMVDVKSLGGFTFQLYLMVSKKPFWVL